MFWSGRPFIRITGFFMAGILTAFYLPLTQQWSVLLLLGIAVICLLLLAVGNALMISWKYRWTNGLLIGFLFTSLGIYSASGKLRHASLLSPPHDEMIGRIVSEPSGGPRTLKLILEADRGADRQIGQESAVKIMAYMEADSQSSLLQQGDVIVFNGSVSQPEPPKNPEEFNYSDYLALNGIHYQVYLAHGSWQYIDHQEVNFMVRAASRLRSYLLQTLANNGLDQRSTGVAAAIVLGYDQLLEDDLQQDFVRAGAMHILCISGLHVGIIYLVMNVLLGFLRKDRWHRFLKAVLLLAVVWFYAMITGFSPSVQRAAIMISLFIIGNATSRNNDSFNTLAASAFLILWVDPLLLFHVGFQLSFTAVIGILWFYKPIYQLIYTKNKILDSCWSVAVVSLAAQMGTFPLAAHYFHFFPTYFMVSNLLIFPLSFLIISAGMLFIVFSWIPIAASLTAYVLTSLIYLLNMLVGFVKYLPYSGLDQLFFPWPKVILVYALIISLFQFLIEEKIQRLSLVLWVLLILLSFQTLLKVQSLSRQRLVVYAIRNHSAIEFVHGRDHLLLLDTTLISDVKKRNFHLRNSRIAWQLDDVSAVWDGELSVCNGLWYFDGEFGCFGGKRFFIPYPGKTYHFDGAGAFDVEILFIRGQASLDLQALHKQFHPRQIVLDGSVPKWKQKRMVESAVSLGIPCYNVMESGAFMVDLQASGVP